MSEVEVEGVGKRFGATPVLEDVTLRFAEGRFTSLLGPSGSGKTTLLRLIGGFVAPDRGRVLMGGEDVTAVPLWRRRVGMVFQSYALFPHMTVAENVAYGLRRRGLRGAAVRDEVARALELVQLAGLAARRPKQLSGGQQQRVALARAIVTKPRVLLLDEPLAALDRRLRQTMQIELKRIQRDTGLTTIFVTHDQEEALTLSDRVAILDQGRIVQEGEPGEVYERPRTSFTARFLGDANLLTGVVNRGAVETPSGLLHAAGHLPLDGTRVTLAVRPEKISLEPNGGVGATNSLTVVVREVIYGGASSVLLLTTGDGTPFKLLQHNTGHQPIAAGATIQVFWAVRDTVVLQDAATDPLWRDRDAAIRGDDPV